MHVPLLRSLRLSKDNDPTKSMILLSTQGMDPILSLSCKCGQCLICFLVIFFLVNGPKKEINLAGPVFPISEMG